MGYKKYVIKKCKTCNKDFKTYLQYIKKGNGKFCSLKCFGKWYSQIKGEKHPRYSQIILKCEKCGKSFSTFRCRKKRKFCSKICFDKSQIGKHLGINSPTWKGGKTKHYCKECGIEFLEYKYRKRNFCSRKCEGSWLSKNLRGEQHHSWTGGLPKCPICGKILSRGSKTCFKHKPPMSIERRQKNSDALKGKMPKNIMYVGKFRNIKRGNYIINEKEMFFRSKWEANYALYLDFLIKQNKILKWEYEADAFIFEKIKFGTRSFRPDFKIFNNDDSIEYHEIKGWMDNRSKTKFNRMRIYYPQIKLRLIGKQEYALLKSQLGAILKFY